MQDYGSEVRTVLREDRGRGIQVDFQAAGCMFGQDSREWSPPIAHAGSEPAVFQFGLRELSDRL